MTPGIAPHSILAVLAELPGAQACLDAAAVAASVFKYPQITVLHVRVNPRRDIIPTEEMLSAAQIEEARAEAIHEGEALRKIYETWNASLDRSVTASWVEVEDGEEEEVIAFGSKATLAVMANLSRESRGHARTAFHACLFETGRPLLVAPRTFAVRPPERIVVGWKDERSTGRALKVAKPWLKSAETVEVLHIGAQSPSEGDGLRERLQTFGLAEAEVRTIEHKAMSIGRQLLEEAGVFHADWLVTGAYRHGSFLEWVFGGVTETLLAEATLPILMCH